MSQFQQKKSNPFAQKKSGGGNPFDKKSSDEDTSALDEIEALEALARAERDEEERQETIREYRAKNSRQEQSKKTFGVCRCG